MDLREERDFWRTRALDLEARREILHFSSIPLTVLEELRVKCEQDIEYWYSHAHKAYVDSKLYTAEKWTTLYEASLFQENQIEYWKKKYEEATAFAKTQLLMEKIRKHRVRFTFDSKS